MNRVPKNVDRKISGDSPSTKTYSSINFSLNDRDFKRQYLKNSKTIIQRIFSIESFSLWPEHVIRILQPNLMLSILAVVFISYYAKCYQNFNLKSNLDRKEYLTNFTRYLTNNTPVTIGIPFCSCLYEDGHYLEKLTPLGFLYSVFKNLFILLEASYIIIFDTKWRVFLQKGMYDKFAKYGKILLSKVLCISNNSAFTDILIMVYEEFRHSFFVRSRMCSL